MASFCQCVIFMSLCAFHVNGYTPPVYYLDQKCEPYKVYLRYNRDLRLKLTKNNNTKLDKGMNCVIKFSPVYPEDKMMITVRSFHTKSSRDCLQNSLNIVGQNSKPLNGVSGDCGVVTNKVYTAPSGFVTFTFKTGFVTQTGQFDLLLTAFSDSPCLTSRFKYNNSHCISPELKCNGFNDCGDNSDEGSVCRDSNVGTHPFAGTAVGAIALIAILVISERIWAC